MRIGLLNLPLDNNFGGNLQRFALIKIIQSLGHEPVHVQILFSPHRLPFFKKPLVYMKRFLEKIIIDHNRPIFREKIVYERYKKKLELLYPFYNRYIPHTEPCYCIDDVRQMLNYDLYIIGSDQVWRKMIADKYLGVMMGEILPYDVKRIAYAISFGTDENELSDKEIAYYGKLYKNFSAVSVREISGLELLNKYGWTEPVAIHLLDPTFLLDKREYKKIAEYGNIQSKEASLFCYILDESKETIDLIEHYSTKTGLSPYIVSLNSGMTIENWLKSFDNASFVITDSYHGLIFSIIFNKPYRLIRNSFRGNARFDSVLQTFGLTDDGSGVDWDIVNKKVFENRIKSTEFIIKAIGHNN